MARRDAFYGDPADSGKFWLPIEVDGGSPGHSYDFSACISDTDWTM